MTKRKRPTKKEFMALLEVAVFLADYLPDFPNVSASGNKELSVPKYAEVWQARAAGAKHLVALWVEEFGL